MKKLISLVLVAGLFAITGLGCNKDTKPSTTVGSTGGTTVKSTTGPTTPAPR